MKYIVVLFLLSPPAHAGWWADFKCGKWLIQDDPYQFEPDSTDFVIKRFERDNIRAAWGKLTPQEQDMRNILRRELERRLQYGDPSEADKILETLKVLDQKTDK